MRVLGLGTEGDSGAAIVEDGRILAAVNEERLSRLKLVEGFPRGSIQEVLRLTGTTIADLDAVWSPRRTICLSTSSGRSMGGFSTASMAWART